MGIGMRIGINGSADINDLERTVAEAARAEAAGFDSFWTAQIFGFDALTAVAVVGQTVPRIELGTAVVPTYPRHPMVMAGQALTVQVAIGGRLALGIGLSHQIVVENMWGYSWSKPVRHMREYLDSLMPLLRGEGSDVRTDDLTSVGSIDLHGATPPPVLVAALGPQLLKVAGSRGCGTVTWCTGERTLADHIVPSITAAAEEASQPGPRIVASLPISVTTDIEGTRKMAEDVFVIYGGLPSYRAMLDREGADGPADVAILGDEDHVTASLRRLADSGVTDFAAVVTTTSTEDRDRTWDLLADLHG